MKNITFTGRDGERGKKKSFRVKKGWTQGPEENLRVGKYPVNWIQQQAGSGEFSRSKRVKVSSEL